MIMERWCPLMMKLSPRSTAMIAASGVDLWWFQGLKRHQEPGGTLFVGRQYLQSGSWEVIRGIFLLDFAFKVLALVMLSRRPSFFIISSLKLDLRETDYLIYAMTSARPDIAYVVGRLSRFTSNPSRQHWKTITRVFKYLRGTKDYGLSYVGYPSVLEAYLYGSWINHAEDTYSTSRWVFLLGRGPKPIAPISIRCDSVLTMAKAYSQVYNGKSRHLEPLLELSDPKRKTLDEKGIDCIFVGYAEHFKAYRFYVIEPNESVSINSIIESRDAIFDENRFSSIPRPKDIISNSVESQGDGHSNDVPSEIPEPRKGKRVRKAKSYGSDFQLYLVEGSRDHVGSQYSYCYSIEEDPRTYDEDVQSRDAAFWKEAIDDEIGSIMKNNTWVLSDLPPGFRQREGINYFDTYAPVARITTIRLLLDLAAIHNLVIHQMDVNTSFLNGDLDEKMYMKQPEGFVLPGNEHKVCKLVKSLYGLKQAPKQWHQKFDEVVLSSGFHLNQSDKCVYNKFDDFGKGVIICLYVDDMLIFGTDQNQVDKTKKFLSSRFSMKDMGEADVILGIKIKLENKEIVITQSHYIEKILKKFNREDCSPVSTPMDPVEKLKSNTGKPVDQLEYSRVIGCLMYAMTSTRPDIAYVVGKLNILSCVRSYSVLVGNLLKIHLLRVDGALVAAGKEAEWLRNLIHEIPIWPKPVAPISIRCDSVLTMAKAYSQVYNEKYRHLVLPLQEAWTWLPICSLMDWDTWLVKCQVNEL
ncbi:zinc finger, CCHC-type containing protein [Tanacetum coccineum]